MYNATRSFIDPCNEFLGQRFRVGTQQSSLDFCVPWVSVRGFPLRILMTQILSLSFALYLLIDLVIIPLDGIITFFHKGIL